MPKPVVLNDDGLVFPSEEARDAYDAIEKPARAKWEAARGAAIVAYVAAEAPAKAAFQAAMEEAKQAFIAARKATRERCDRSEAEEDAHIAEEWRRIAVVGDRAAIRDTAGCNLMEACRKADADFLAIGTPAMATYTEVVTLARDAYDLARWRARKASGAVDPMTDAVWRPDVLVGPVVCMTKEGGDE